MNKTILLISANIYDVPYPVYPLGISYIATYLNNAAPEYKVKLFDFITSQPEALVKCLKEDKPVLTGISLRNVDNVDSTASKSFIDGYKEIIRLVRDNSKSPIVTGGSAFSIFPRLMFDTLKPDFGIHGEGEESLRKLLLHLEENTNYENIEGLVYVKDGKTIVNPRKNSLSDLNLEFDSSLVDFYWQNSGMLNVQTKRGCPFNCIYCTYPIIDGRTVRTLNPEKIVQTLKILYETKGIDYVFFTDSVFNIATSFNEELASRLIKSGIKIKWGAYFSLHNLTADMLSLYKESGLTHIEFGTESLSEIQLRNYGKHFSVGDIFEKSEICNKIGVDFAHFLILGGYGETDDTIEETFSNSAKIKRTVFFPFIGMRIYPGTKLQEYAIRDGYITADDNLLEPKYYISKNFDASLIKDKAAETGKRWVFPDEDLSAIMHKMRLKNKKGPLWEYMLK